MTSINDIPVANGIGTCFEEHQRLVQTNLGGGVLLNTIQAVVPRPRTAILGDVTQAEALSLGAVLTVGATCWLVGDFIPPSAAIGTVQSFSATIEAASGRGVGRLVYTTLYEVSEGTVYTEDFL